MSILGELLVAMQAVEEAARHRGYWYCISEALTVMVCQLQTIDDIHEWAISVPTKALFLKEFGLERVPCRAQFYNILGRVDPEKFSATFNTWVRAVLI